MTENVIGTYDCDDCGSTFKIEGTAMQAYDGWLPACPVCGYDDHVRQTEQPKHTA